MAVQRAEGADQLGDEPARARLREAAALEQLEQLAAAHLVHDHVEHVLAHLHHLVQLGHVLRRGSVRAAQRGRLLDEGVHCLLVLLERGHVHLLERNVHAPFGCRVHLREAALSEHLAELVALGDVADLAIDDLGLVQPRAQRDHGTEPCAAAGRGSSFGSAEHPP